MIVLSHVVDGVNYIIEIMPIMGMVRCGRILADSGRCIATFSAMPMPKNLIFQRERCDMTSAQISNVTQQIRPFLIPHIFGWNASDTAITFEECINDIVYNVSMDVDASGQWYGNVIDSSSDTSVASFTAIELPSLRNIDYSPTSTTMTSAEVSEVMRIICPVIYRKLYSTK